MYTKRAYGIFNYATIALQASTLLRFLLFFEKKMRKNCKIILLRDFLNNREVNMAGDDNKGVGY